jgi:hypothetical protein
MGDILRPGFFEMTPLLIQGGAVGGTAGLDGFGEE